MKLSFEKEWLTLKKLSRFLSLALSVTIVGGSFAASGNVAAKEKTDELLRSSIQSGETLYDTNGNVVQAHGGGFLKVDAGTRVNTCLLYTSRCV